MQDYIEKVIKPKLMGDGGWIDYVSLDGDELTLVFRGECSKCLIVERCLDWIKEQIKSDLGQTVTINAVKKRPFFWDR